MNFEEENKIKYNMSTVKNIITEVENKLKDLVLTLHQDINNDNERYIEKNDISKLLSIVKKIKSEKWIMSENSNNIMYCGIGNVGVSYNGRTDVFLYLALKALKTGNNIIFFEDEPHQATLRIRNAIKEVCQKYQYSTYLEFEKYSDFIGNQSNLKKLNMCIFVNEQQKYFDFCARINNGMKIICSNYGNMDIYIDDIQLKDRLSEMEDYLYQNDIDFELYNDKNVEDVVKKMNAKKHNYCTVIFTSNKQDAYYFLNNIDSEKIFINRNPKDDYDLIMPDDEFVKIKKVYM